jgi:hypothetical protein
METFMATDDVQKLSDEALEARALDLQNARDKLHDALMQINAERDRRASAHEVSRLAARIASLTPAERAWPLLHARRSTWSVARATFSPQPVQRRHPRQSAPRRGTNQRQIPVRVSSSPGFRMGRSLHIQRPARISRHPPSVSATAAASSTSARTNMSRHAPPAFDVRCWTSFAPRFIACCMAASAPASIAIPASSPLAAAPATGVGPVSPRARKLPPRRHCAPVWACSRA